MNRIALAASAGLALVCGFALVACADDGAKPKQLPILAWYSVPPEHTTAERMQELADAGFTDSYSNYPSIESARKALDLAQSAGLKIWITLGALRKDPEETVRQLQNHPALGGYVLYDEPSADQFANLAAWSARIQAVDSVHPCYVNLLPNYATTQQLRTTDYLDYVERFAREVPNLPISFDHYPIVGQTLRAGWYENLETIADVAREAKQPFWAFTLSVAFGSYPIAETAHMRLQVYSDLAYGAQAIQYFTYWTAPPWMDDDYHDGPIDPAGHRTPVYDRVKQVNAELKALSPIFVGSTVERLGHTGERLPAGTQRYQPAWPVKELDAKAGAVVSHLANDHQRYLMVVNRSFLEPLDFSVVLDPKAAMSLVGKDGRPEPLASARYQTAIAPGDVAILAWTTDETPGKAKP